MTCRHKQSCYNRCARYETRSVTATFSDPTVLNNLIVVEAIVGGGSCGVVGPAGFTLIRSVSYGLVQLMVWYLEGAPVISSVTVSVNNDRSLQVRAMEFEGVRQSNALDKVTVLSSRSNRCNTGNSGTTTQADGVVVACVANSTTSCTQSGFFGGLVRFFEDESPQFYGHRRRHGREDEWEGSNNDEDRTRLTTHLLIAQITQSFSLQALLSSSRDWVAILITFKGGVTGPKKFSATMNQPGPALRANGSNAILMAFGKFKSTLASPIALSQTTNTATIFPFEYQYLLNGVLLTGAPWIDDWVHFRVISHDGLYGYSVRTSDNDQPRGDGALRGIDLQSARQIIFEMEVTDTPDGIERDLDILKRAMIPRRDVDWEMTWRHPGQGPRLMRCRPIEAPRQVDRDGTFVAKQHLALRAADPRHYSAVQKTVAIPVTPANALTPTYTNVTNLGDVPAYPIITVTGPTSGPPVTRLILTNQTGLISFDVELTLNQGSVLVGDMQSRMTGAPVSVVTLDGQSVYGAWQLPRDAFRLEADPSGQAGYNVLYLQTTPAGAPITCTLDYRDCWSG